MSLIIETQFAALTVDENGKISPTNDQNNNDMRTTAGDDTAFNNGTNTALNNMTALGDSLPLPEDTIEGLGKPQDGSSHASSIIYPGLNLSDSR